MKRLIVLFCATRFLCACGDDLPREGDGSTVAETSSVELSVACTHAFGDEPVEIVGNLYVFECVHCGAREVDPQGTPIGGEE